MPSRFIGALERVLYVATRNVLSMSFEVRCTECGAKPGEWCQTAGTKVFHAIRLRRATSRVIKEGLEDDSVE